MSEPVEEQPRSTKPEPAEGRVLRQSKARRARAMLIYFAIVVVTTSALRFCEAPDSSPASTQTVVDAGTAGFRPLLSPAFYMATPPMDDRLSTFTRDVMQFTLLHEIGHVLVNEYQLPVPGGKEEDVADSFAVWALTPHPSRADSGQSQASVSARVLLDAAAFWDGLFRFEHGNQKQGFEWADEHSLSEQRAFTVGCLLYGSNPEALMSLARYLQLTIERRNSCAAEARQNDQYWSNALRNHASTDNNIRLLNENLVAFIVQEKLESLSSTVDPGAVFAKDGAQVDVAYHPVGAKGTSDDLSATQRILEKDELLDFAADILTTMRPPHGRLSDQNVLFKLAAPARGDRTPSPWSDYHVVGDPCLATNGEPIADAMWDEQKRSLTVCYGLVGLVDQIGRSLLAEQGQVQGQSTAIGSPPDGKPGWDRP